LRERPPHLCDHHVTHGEVHCGMARIDGLLRCHASLLGWSPCIYHDARLRGSTVPWRHRPDWLPGAKTQFGGPSSFIDSKGSAARTEPHPRSTSCPNLHEREPVHRGRTSTIGGALCPSTLGSSPHQRISPAPYQSR